ncbi:MAG TPA: hypothetical protein RMH99_05240 [Sandaracinaceae bacterium LLY-WYZ-13_1]|nr:hypothetical protein [Sandaracinaceae bacterium LLY-WYZ-13_1]
MIVRSPARWLLPAAFAVAALVVGARPLHAEPPEAEGEGTPADAAPADDAEAPAESPEARAARQARQRRAAGGHPGIWAVSRRIAATADEAARALELPLPEVTTWYRPPGACRGCSNAHARGGITLALDGICEADRAGCAELREARRRLARELSRRLGRHYRVSVIELGDDPRQETHRSFRNGGRDGRPYRLRRAHRAEVIVVRPEPMLPPPAELVFGDATTDAPADGAPPEPRASN